MENLKNFYDKYRVYLTRPRLEILAVVAIVFCAVLVFFLNIPGKGVLSLIMEPLFTMAVLYVVK